MTGSHTFILTKKRVKIIAALLALLILYIYLLAGCDSHKPDDTVAVDATVTQTESQPPTEEPIVHPVDAAWFDDAVFVGDSVTLRLSYYADENEGAIGNAQFVCAGSLGYTNAQWAEDDPTAVHPVYRGKVTLAENCTVATGADKVFIMLGMNDIGLYGVDETLKSADSLVNKILAHTPEAKIYLQSTTPILKGKEIGELNNKNIRAFDKKLEQYAQEHGYKYLDLYNQLCDEGGYLKNEYCSDAEAMGIHFSPAACEIWIEYLKNNV